MIVDLERGDILIPKEKYKTLAEIVSYKVFIKKEVLRFPTTNLESLNYVFLTFYKNGKINKENVWKSIVERTSETFNYYRKGVKQQLNYSNH